ncbi:MAG: SRPBCC family protein [Pseudomonadota bacterium]
MRVFKWLIGGIAGLAIIFLGGAFLLPKDVTVARSIEIDAPAEDIFPHINNLKAAGAWSPWLGKDPAVELTYTGPEEGVGAKLAWASEDPQVGNGTQEITLSEKDKRVQTALDFGPMGQALADFQIEEIGGATRVTWGFETDMGNNPTWRWMGLMMDSWVGADYEAGLANLKTLIEG